MGKCDFEIHRISNKNVNKMIDYLKDVNPEVARKYFLQEIIDRTIRYGNDYIDKILVLNEAYPNPNSAQYAKHGGLEDIAISEN